MTWLIENMTINDLTTVTTQINMILLLIIITVIIIISITRVFYSIKSSVEDPSYGLKKVIKPNKYLSGKWIEHKSRPGHLYMVDVHGNSCSLYATKEDYNEKKNKIGSPATKGICKKFVKL